MFIDAEKRIEHLEELTQREKFSEWLQKQSEETEVGRACIPDCCPLAVYLRSQGAQRVVVDCCRIGADGVEIPMPVWVQLFVSHVDVLNMEASITKAMAVAFLIDE